MLDEKERGPNPLFRRRVRIIALLIVLAGTVLTARLWRLQIEQGEYYNARSVEQRLRPLRLRAPRGTIFGRNGVKLADNRAACDVVIIPADCDDPEAVATRLENLLHIDGEKLREEVERHKRSSQPFHQVVVKPDVSQTEVMRVEAYNLELPGVLTVVSPRRRYYFGKTAGQVLGYMGKINREEYEKLKGTYAYDDSIGRSGLELYYEDLLKGVDGRILVNVYASGAPQLRTDEFGLPIIGLDSMGRRLEEEEAYRRDPQPGNAIELTLDIGLQRKAEALLESHPDSHEGAIVVLNAETGAVLAMASVPSYDPGVFVTTGRAQERHEALNGQYKPAVNRAVQEHYHPGSVFKIVVAAGALEDGVANEHTSFSCGGSISKWGRRWNCWSHGHGSTSLERALSESCDVYFYQVGAMLDVDGISKWSYKFGLGQKTGIDLPLELAGIVPSREWKKEWGQANFPDNPSEWRWYPGETPSFSIGQGALSTTPLQNAVVMAAIVNGGRIVRPYLNAALGPEVSEPIISPRTVELIRQGLQRCIEDKTPPSGTGHRAAVPGMKVIGKTGTAQRVALSITKAYGKDEYNIPYHLRDDALFVCGVLDQDPPIAISILVEHGLHGSTGASILARDLIEQFYYGSEPPTQVAQRVDAP